MGKQSREGKAVEGQTPGGTGETDHGYFMEGLVCSGSRGGWAAAEGADTSTQDQHQDQWGVL